MSSSLINGRILEIGCGSGLIINQFEQDLGKQIDGCDLNLFALEKVKNSTGKLFCLNIFDKPATLIHSYNTILLMDVIEHIDDDNTFLQAAKEYLNPNEEGFVALNVPALNMLYSKYDLMDGHKRRYTKKMIRQLFSENNIEPLVITYWGITMFPVVLLRKVVLWFFSKKRAVEIGFKPPNKAVNWLFDQMLHIEHQLCKSPWFGTSVIAVGKIKN